MSRTLIQTTKILSVVVFAFMMINCDAGSFVDPVEVDTEQEPRTLALDSLLEPITEDDSISLRGTVVDQDGQAIENVELTWASSDDRIADVEDASGTDATLIAKQPGSATITATYETLSASTTIEVHNRPVDLVYVSGSGQATFAGQVLADSLVVLAIDRRGDPVSGVSLQMAVTAGGGSVAPVTGRTDGNGHFRSAWTLGDPGGQRVEVRASEGQTRVKNMKDSVVVFTADAAAVLASLNVSPATATLEEGDTLRLDANATTSGGTAVDSPKVNWSTTNSTVATVDIEGVARARQAGNAQIIVSTTSGGTILADTSDVTVTEPVASVTGVEIRPATATVDTGGTQQFEAVALMSDNTEKVATVDWSATGGTLSSEGIYTADATEGVFAVTISHDLGYSDTATVTVVAPEPAVARVTISPATDTVEVGGTSQLTATVLDGDGNTLTDRSVTWSSSEEAVTTVDGTGLVTGISTGQATITATADGVRGNASITVAAAAPGSITILPAGDTLYGIGATLSLSAEARQADGTLISDPGIQWTSHDPDIATVDSMGTLTARALGTVLITATAVCCTGDSAAFVVEPVEAGDPAQVSDLSVASVTETSVTLQWTDVEDGTGEPANYTIRYGSPTLSWGDAYATETVVEGVAIGERQSHTFTNLSPATEYEFAVASYRGTLDVDAVFGALSNYVSTSTDGPAALTVSPQEVTLVGIGDTLTLEVQAHEADGSPIPDVDVVWTSSDTGIVTVDGNGTVTARAFGAALVIATALCCAGDTAHITVTDPTNQREVQHPNEPAGYDLVGEYAFETGTTKYNSALGREVLASTEGWNEKFTNADHYMVREQLSPGDGPLGGSDAPYAVRHVYPTGAEGGGGGELDSPHNLGLSEIYVRYYVRVNSLWHGHTDSGVNKMIYIHGTSGSFSAYWYEIWGRDLDPLGVKTVNQAGSGGNVEVGGTTFVRDQWHRVEIVQKQSGTVEMWVDGTKVVDRSGINFNTATVSYVTMSGIWGGVGGSKAQEDFMEFAYVRISGR